MAKADGIVFDLRGYPSFDFRPVIARLIDETVTSAQWHVPLVHHPDRRDMRFQFSNWSVRPKSPRFSKNVAFITDGRAISAAETLLGIIEHYKLAEIVGAPTAGTNGNINPFWLPGGYHVTWTGMRVLKHDGSQHHGVGIQPTVPCVDRANRRDVEGCASAHAGRSTVRRTRRWPQAKPAARRDWSVGVERDHDSSSYPGGTALCMSASVRLGPISNTSHHLLDPCFPERGHRTEQQSLGCVFNLELEPRLPSSSDADGLRNHDLSLARHPSSHFDHTGVRLR